MSDALLTKDQKDALAQIRDKKTREKTRERLIAHAKKKVKK